MKTQRTPLIRFLVFRGLGPIFLLFLFAGKTRASFGHVDTLSPHSPNEDSLLAALASAKTRPAPETAAALSRLTRFGMGNLFTRFEYDPLLPYSLQVNPHAETYMNSYLRRHETSLTALHQWAVPYFDLIQTILSAYGLPHELKYLAVIESQLNTRATSRTGAAGPWQFMPATARQYGLRLGRGVDERRDYFKSTDAAARLLLDLYRRYHDWLLVVAAYNGGSGRVDQAIRRSGSRDFWTLQHDLPEESRNHVKKFLATHYVMEGRTAGGLGAATPAVPATDEAGWPALSISGKYLSEVLIQLLQLDKKEFHRYNPDFDRTLMAGKPYPLRLPTAEMEAFQKRRYEILNASVNRLLAE